jgi:carbon-monoxide dehydrogenase small subunit/xanthine dehydrogenase YagT iron-sulfur-binding subunit
VRVNGTSVENLRGERLLGAYLRDTCGLTSVKLACERGECGACTVLVRGLPVASCVLPVALADDVETSEGVVEETRDLRADLADAGGFQCGFCTPGQVMSALALLRRGLPEDDADARAAIRTALAGNICRCTGYTGLVEGILRACRRAGVRT